MQLDIIVFIICALINSSFAGPPRIIAGTNAKEGEFPYMVSVQPKSGWPSCGGSIIAPKWILSAAHCTLGGPKYKVQYGSLKWNPNSRDIALISKVFLHPQFDKITGKNDILLFKLATAIPFGPKVNAVRLPKQNQKIPMHVETIVMGWGLNNETAHTDILQKVVLKTINNTECQWSYTDKVLDTTFCVVDFKWSRGTCHGDSGSPVILNNELIGIVSKGIKKCIIPELPTRATQVSLYTNFILDTMKRNP